MEEITIFGKSFVEANKNKCNIIFEEEVLNLETTFNLKFIFFKIYLCNLIYIKLY